MMKNSLVLSVLSTTIVAVGFAGNTVAETWSPTGAGTVFGSFNIAAGGGQSAGCSLSGSLTLNGSSATVGSSDGISSSPVFCGGLIYFVEQPYNLEPSSLNSVTLQNFHVVGLIGGCAGDLTGEFDQLTGRITFDNVTVPSTGGFIMPCKVSAILETSPQATYTIP